LRWNFEEFSVADFSVWRFLQLYGSLKVPKKGCLIFGMGEVARISETSYGSLATFVLVSIGPAYTFVSQAGEKT
jgi:hypothetical protein